jgi:DNA-binding PadR family transcriptional regulator
MYVDILILAHLVRRPYHGYELKREVERFGFSLNNNQLYPKLRQFEEMGAITREVERQTGRPDRHIYRITDRGEEMLQAMLQEFPPELARDDGEFFARVALFHLIDPDVRRTILTIRQEATQELLRNMAQFQALMEQDPNNPQAHYSLSELRYLQRRLQLELDWIATLFEEVNQ